MRWRKTFAIPVALAALAAGLTVSAATQARAATTESLSAAPVQETDAGPARTIDVPGGGYVVAHAFGTIAMVGADGKTAWQVGTGSLYKDWDLTWQRPGFTYTPELAWGTDPFNPLEFLGEDSGLINDVNPVAAGELNGNVDVAVAETVGTFITPQSPFFLFTTGLPFNVPGSSLHVGTFVTVLDARTGKLVYDELDPGYVTQLAIAGGRLIVGNETGDPQTPNGPGQWGSVTTVRALTLTGTGTAQQDWAYSTGAPWAHLLDLTTTGGSQPGIAVAWSDTPPGLGVPGPPDGRVLLLNAATGAVRWQVSTPGYPVLTAADDQRGELAVVQMTDPTVAARYRLTGLRYSNGSVAVSAPRPGDIPLSLAVGSGADDGWAVGAVDTTLQDGNYNFGDGRVTLADPATGSQLWSAALPTTSYGQPTPGAVAITGGQVVVGSWLGSVTPTAATPLEQADSIVSLNYRTATAVWTHTGDPGDPMSLSVVSHGAGLVRAVNSREDVETYTADGSVTEGTSGGAGEFISATTASVASADSTDLVAGNEDGDVDALDGRALSAGTEQVLWQAHLPGPVNQIVRTTLDGREVLVAAATNAVAVLDATTGKVLTLIAVPGTYAYSVTVISAGGTPAVVVPGSSLTAYALATGAPLWSYAAPSGASFSDAAYAGGVVAAEYSNGTGESGKPATEMAAVGLSAGTGKVAWSQAADPSVVQSGQLWNGTFASPDIAGAGGDGVAFAWLDLDGNGQVDVRNIATGALLYSDASRDLFPFTQFLATPSLGLVGVSASGAAQITPSGAQASGYPWGQSAALATSSSGDTALLVADAGVNAFSTDIFTTSSPSSLASSTTYDSGLLVSGDFAGNGTQQVVGMPADWTAYQIVNGETGFYLPPYDTLVQQGLAVFTLTDSDGSSAQAPAATPASGTSSSARYPVLAAPKPGSASSESTALPAGSRLAGQPGSSVPAPEPERSGTAQPGTASSVPAKHTADSAADPTAPPGYSPAQLTAYLGLTGDGAGQTIAIVDAYDDPDIVSDAETYSQQFGLPGVCGAGGTAGDCFTLDVKQQSASAGSNADWALETSLDVEEAHALAPRATIELVEASVGNFASMFRAVATAVASHPAAVSMSWGINTEFSEETYYDHFCAVTSTVCVVSSGDYGNPGEYPAYNPSVLAIGGTTLNLASDGSVTSELAWSGSGGGQSWVEPEPAYQNAVQDSGHRQMPDVSFDADPNTGVAIYDSVPYGGQSGWWEVGGTSVGAPSWSAILADADQLRAADGEAPLTAAGDAVQHAIYSLPSSLIAPVTTGPANGFCPVGCTPTAGYDEITGLGSPRAGIDAALAGSDVATTSRGS
jgi:hypothetical protein